MTMPPLLVPLLAAGLIIGAAFGFCVLTELWLRWELRHALRQARAAGKLPPQQQNADPDDASLVDVGVPVHPITMRVSSIAHFLSHFALFLIPLVIAVCFVTAWLTGLAG